MLQFERRAAVCQLPPWSRRNCFKPKGKPGAKHCEKFLLFTISWAAAELESGPVSLELNVHPAIMPELGALDCGE